MSEGLLAMVLSSVGGQVHGRDGGFECAYPGLLLDLQPVRRARHLRDEDPIPFETPGIIVLVTLARTYSWAQLAEQHQRLCLILSGTLDTEYSFVRAILVVPKGLKDGVRCVDCLCNASIRYVRENEKFNESYAVPELFLLRRNGSSANRSVIG